MKTIIFKNTQFELYKHLGQNVAIPNEIFNLYYGQITIKKDFSIKLFKEVYILTICINKFEFETLKDLKKFCKDSSLNNELTFENYNKITAVKN